MKQKTYVTTQNVTDSDVRFQIFKSSFYPSVYLTFKVKNWLLYKYQLLQMLFGFGNYRIVIIKQID